MQKICVSILLNQTTELYINKNKLFFKKIDAEYFCKL